MLLTDPTILVFPCLIITDSLTILDVYTAEYKGKILSAKDIHKAKTKVRGILVHNIGEFITNIQTHYTVLHKDMFYRTEKQLQVRKYARRILQNNMKTIKVAGFSFLIRHNDPRLQVKNLGSEYVYAILYEWRNLVFYKGKSDSKTRDINVRI